MENISESGSENGNNSDTETADTDVKSDIDTLNESHSSGSEEPRELAELYLYQNMENVFDAIMDEKEIDLSLLQERFNLKTIVNLSVEKSEVNLCHRLSYTEVFRRGISDLKRAQEEYATQRENVFNFLSSNIADAVTMDTVFDDVPNGILNKPMGRVIHKLPDGTLKLQCPLNGCDSETYRLKRHLESLHTGLNGKKVDYCVKMARKIAKNKSENPECELAVTAEKIKVTGKHKSVVHMNKKGNYVNCVRCKFITSNISQHLKESHKINRKNYENYDETIKSCKVVPKVYTKLSGKSILELSGEELKKAEEKYGILISKEKEVMHQLKHNRDQIVNLNEKISQSESKEEVNVLRNKLRTVTETYKEYRYRDTRKYSIKTKEWRDSFEGYLIMRENHNPKRSAHMAIDVLLHFEADTQPLTFGDLMETRVVRNIVQKFKWKDHMKAASKIKYLKMFSSLMQFLLCDCDSPEMRATKNAQQKIRDDISFKEARHEIETAIYALSKKTGLETLQTREKTQKNLIDKEGLLSLSNSVRENLLKIKNIPESDLDKFSVSKIIAVRNDLMAIAALNLGRRSTELATMTLEEIDDAEETELNNGEIYFVVQVLQQKNLRNGKKAAVTFKDDEFKILQIFIKKLRSKICFNEHVKCAFPSTAEGGKQMSLGAVWKILTQYKSPKGIKLTSQVGRKSKVSNSRTSTLTFAQKEATALAMGHDVTTADRYYAITSLTNSTNACLSAEKMHTSKNKSLPISPIAGTSKDPDRMFSTPIEKPPSSDRGEVSLNSAKRKLMDSDSDQSDPDITLKNLRSKKLKSVNSTDKLELEKAIRVFIDGARSSGTIGKIVNGNGFISVKHITSNLPEKLCSKFSLKAIRAITKKYLRNKYFSFSKYISGNDFSNCSWTNFFSIIGLD